MVGLWLVVGWFVLGWGCGVLGCEFRGSGWEWDRNDRIWGLGVSGREGGGGVLGDPYHMGGGG